MSGTAAELRPAAPGAALAGAGAAQNHVNRTSIIALAATCVPCMLSMAVHACGATLDGGSTIDSARYSIAYRTDPARIAVGKPFAVDLVVCSKDAGVTIDELRVDAHMPEHRHGMNYTASIKPHGTTGRYRAEGLMFHMPGKWEFLFDVRDARGVERLKQDYPLK